MNNISYLTVLSVINDRKTVHIKELERLMTDKRAKGDPTKNQALFARIDECDKFLQLIKSKIDATAESDLRDKFKELEAEIQRDHSFDHQYFPRDPDSSGRLPHTGDQRTIAHALGIEEEGAKVTVPDAAIEAVHPG